MVKDKSGEGGQTAVGLDPINECVQLDVLQLHRRKIDFCCAQETRWRGESARMLGAC